MAGDPTPSGPNLGGNAFVWLALMAAATAYMGSHPKLEDLRPHPNAIQTVRTTAVQDVDARLWQDPFQAVLKEDGITYGWSIDSNEKSLSPCMGSAQPDPHCISPLDRLKEKARSIDQVLGVMVPGSPYFEDAEFRRRTRYAVLAALDRLGYVPSDAQHIGVFIPRAEPTKQQGGEDSGANPGDLRFVPYEIMDRRGDGKRALVVFWLDEGAFSDRPLDRLVTLSQALGVPERRRFKIIGPEGSDTLFAMMCNIPKQVVPGEGSRPTQCQPEGSSPAADRKTLPLDIYDYSATADPAALCRAAGEICSDGSPTQPKDWVAAQFDSLGIGFSRATATDDVLARAIRSELERRGIHVGEQKGPHIALISEWDTFYGRTLPVTFARCLKGSIDVQCDEIRTDARIEMRTGAWLSRYSYLRGLDGQRPDTSTRGSSQNGSMSSTSNSASTSETAQAAPDRLLSGTAQGEAQADYLTRLAAQLRGDDERLRNEGGEGIRAVGVLGSDIYDKLLVFQAVKSALPHAVFFTTDLDERLIRPAHAVSTVNLIVATGLGLSLGQALQGDIPPFRGSYQTAAFLATLMAARPEPPALSGTAPKADPSPSSWFAPAELYQMGRTEPIFVRTDDRDPPGGRTTDDDCARPDEVLDVFDCTSIRADHPLRQPSSLRAVAFGVLEALGALAFASLLLRLAIGRHPRVAPWLRIAIFRVFRKRPRLWLNPWLRLALVATTSALIVYSVRRYLAHYDAWQLIQGVNLRPSICMQLMTVALGISVIFHVRRCSNANIKSLRVRLCMVGTAGAIEWGRNKGLASLSRNRIRDAWPLYIRKVEDWKSPDGVTTEAANRFWDRYIYNVRHWVQFTRVAGLTLIGMGLAYTMYLAFPTPLATNQSMVQQFDFWVATLDSMMTLAVAFYVADITLFSRAFVREAFPSDDATPIWPRQAREEFAAAHLGLDLQPASEDSRQEKLVTTTMTIAHVSARTTCITRLIYFPFVMVALSMISRTPIFGPSTFAPSVLTVQAVSLLVAFLSAIALRVAAEDARKETLRNLTVLKWRSLTAKPQRRLRDRIDLLIERITALRDGAFSPLSQQPVVRALLLPLGSYGTTLLLTYLSSNR
jgi:hypothetical protein